MNQPPIALILFGPRNPTSPPYGDEKYRLAYEELSQIADQENLILCRASSSWYNTEKHTFDFAWRFRDGHWEEKFRDVKPDVIYDKMRPLPERLAFKKSLAALYPFINNPDLSLLADDKWATYQALDSYQKPSWLISSLSELEEKLAEVTTARYIVKPLFGSGGEGVLAASKNDLTLPHIENFPVLLQEFIDSSKGIEGIFVGPHDLRLVFIDHKLIYSYLRIPAQGNFLANVAQGGSMQIVPNDHLPQSLEKPIEAVRNLFGIYKHSVYTIDFMFEDGVTPYVVEINSMPGLYFSGGQEQERALMYRALVRLLLDVAKNN